ncbi:MAG TPA: histidine kinase dimerization/phospho-acceptor domain-containing protein, partial [Ktedonobacterales bacterium]|nr:histidine kinase dimerization/phospho-acceptor domain-containing protein [Ktedonobacterales bacterium]
SLLLTLLIAALDRVIAPLPNAGVVYLPLIAMLTYHWSWREGALASVFQIACVYLYFLPPAPTLESPRRQLVEQMATLALVDVFILALAQFARTRRALAEREAKRLAALNTIGTALASELDEARLLRLIAETARELTGAGFAAFTLRPVDPIGQPLVPAEGKLFHLAAVVGATPEQEEVFRRVPLGGEGLLAPIFRHGVSVRVTDALAQRGGLDPRATSSGGVPYVHANDGATYHLSPREVARAQAAVYAHGDAPAETLRGVGVPRGHPIVRSFLGAPLLGRDGQVSGGLLLGHVEPNRFTADDETLLRALAAQAAVALDNARLFVSARMRARELDAVFESIADGVMVVDGNGVMRRRNRAAAAIFEKSVAASLESEETTADLGACVRDALAGTTDPTTPITVLDDDGERRDYLLSASPLLEDAESPMAPEQPTTTAGEEATAPASATSGAVVVLHDVTETRKLLAERETRLRIESQRLLLQTVIDELPSGVYLVRGVDARLALANRAAADVWGAVWPVGMPMAEFLASSGTQITGPDDQPLPDDDLATVKAARTGVAVRHHQEIIRRPDGTSLPILLNAVALRPHALHGLLPAAAVEGREREAEAEPAALVVLQDVAALKEAERLKDEFITIAAHELKTPMAAVRGYAGMLLRRMGRSDQTDLADWQVEALETIDQATSRLVELTNDLLDVTRIQAGRMELRPEPHDLVALARRVVKRFQVTTDRHTLSVAVEGPDPYVVVCLDVPRTEQVLSNLLSNAIKYSPDGGPITVTARPDADTGMAELRVRDT